ncbi:MAG: hypothetical protein J5605_05010, partial [Bacteroidales bacterium]|nr:hypothetical protein [Bacteroidales bacterium]
LLQPQPAYRYCVARPLGCIGIYFVSNKLNYAKTFFLYFFQNFIRAWYAVPKNVIFGQVQIQSQNPSRR